MIITKNINIKVNPKNYTHLKNKGYDDIKIGNILNINTEDISDGSNIIVDVKCDICGKKRNIKYRYYINNIRNHGIYTCHKCSRIKNKLTCKEKYGDENYNNRNKSNETLKKDWEIKNQKIIDKREKTCVKKYGVDNVSKSIIIAKKRERTIEKLYGDKIFFKSKYFRDNVKYYRSYENKKYLDNIKKELKKLSIDFIGIRDNKFVLKCKKHGEYEIYPDTLRKRINVFKTETCTICNKINDYKSSNMEKDLYNFINKNCEYNVISNDNNIINPHELDIYIPELKLAFEFNGVWWHNELYKEKNYHLEKTEICEKKGISLTHIYEDDWIYKSDIVKSMILNKLGKTPNKIFARKCEIKEINDNKLIKEFLDHNHIQGFVGSKVKIGLFYENELVSLMTFGKNRLGIGKINDKTIELLRFCNKRNTNVVGGASKLIKYYIKTFNPSTIVSYADRSWSNGKLYEKLEFKLIHKTKPNYYYVIDGIRYHRFKFRKSELIKMGYDKNLTAKEIMFNRKIYRIYGSGNLKFEYSTY